jgi:hypothetical protein
VTDLVASLFTLEKAAIDFEVIKSFCDQHISEGLRVEYKRDFPKNEDLSKTICAFANAEGGIILIGIEADKKNNVPVDIPGISCEKGLEEKVSSICLSHILPRIVPEIRMCCFNLADTSQRAVLFIRISQSYNPPHYVWQTREILVRVNCENVRADLQTIEELFERRKRIREEGNYTSSSTSWSYKYIEIEAPVFETIVIRLNFIKDTVPFNKENDVAFQKIAQKVMTLNDQIPYPNYLQLVSRNSLGQITRACRIDGDRLIFQKTADVDGKRLQAIECFQFLSQVLKASQEFCAYVAFYGNISFGLNIENTESLSLDLPRIRWLDDDYKSEWKTISISRTIGFDDFANLSKTIQGMFEEFCRFFHLSIDSEALKAIVEEYFMPFLK